MNGDFMSRYRNSEPDPSVPYGDEKQIQKLRGNLEDRQFIDAHSLLAYPPPEPKRLIPKFLTEGLSVIAGPPKVGKSTLNKLMAIALVTGGDFLGQKCLEPVKVLELQFEESERLFAKKLRALQADTPKGSYLLDFEQRRGQEGIAYLDRIIKEERISAVSIDCLTSFREATSKASEGFRADYEALSLISRVAKAHPGVAIRLTHHTTKIRPERPADSISGTNGLIAVLDDFLILDEISGRFRLYCGGRNWDDEENTFELAREGGRWINKGAWDELAPASSCNSLSKNEEKVLDCLRTEGAISHAGLARRCDMDTGNLSKVLNGLVGKGLIKKTEQGYQAV